MGRVNVPETIVVTCPCSVTSMSGLTSSTPLLPARILSAPDHKSLWRSGAIFGKAMYCLDATDT